MNVNEINKKDIKLCMVAGCFLGILCFVLVYGVKILDFTYDAWLLCTEIDLKQHYLGFCHLRNNPWTFPLGIISTLSKPFDMSVVYTDSIPLFALIFKLFERFLPVHFQYFGLFGIVSLALMGGLSAVLIRRFTDKLIICIGGSLLFILSFPVLQRMYYHTALAAQWIIILAMILWLYTDISKLKTWIYWGLTAFLCVFIHSYYVFFTGLILLAQAAEYYLNRKCLRSCNLESKDFKNNKFRPLMAIAVFFACSVIALFILGAFYGAGSVTKGGFGDFNGNLNGYINPDGYSRIFKPLSYNGTFEYEGFGYLGAGVFLCFAAALVYIIYTLAVNKLLGRQSFEKQDAYSSDMSLIYAKRTEKIRFIMMLILVLGAVIFSTLPRFSFNDRELLNIPLPAVIRNVFGVCRTNGRFIWIGTYILILLALIFVSRHYKKIWGKILFAAVIILQLYDMSGKVSELHDRYTADYSYEPALMALYEQNMLDNKKDFIYLYDGGDLRMDTAFTAYLLNMSQNTFYFARPIDDDINEHIYEARADFLNGKIQKDAVYIFRYEDYTDEFQAVALENNAIECLYDNHIIVAMQ